MRYLVLTLYIVGVLGGAFAGAILEHLAIEEIRICLSSYFSI